MKYPCTHPQRYPYFRVSQSPWILLLRGWTLQSVWDLFVTKRVFVCVMELVASCQMSFAICSCCRIVDSVKWTIPTIFLIESPDDPARLSCETVMRGWFCILRHCHGKLSLPQCLLSEANSFWPSLSTSSGFSRFNKRFEELDGSPTGGLWEQFAARVMLIIVGRWYITTPHMAKLRTWSLMSRHMERVTSFRARRRPLSRRRRARLGAPRRAIRRAFAVAALRGDSARLGRCGGRGDQRRRWHSACITAKRSVTGNGRRLSVEGVGREQSWGTAKGCGRWSQTRSVEAPLVRSVVSTCRQAVFTSSTALIKASAQNSSTFSCLWQSRLSRHAPQLLILPVLPSAIAPVFCIPTKQATLVALTPSHVVIPDVSPENVQCQVELPFQCEPHINSAWPHRHPQLRNLIWPNDLPLARNVCLPIWLSCVPARIHCHEHEHPRSTLARKDVSPVGQPVDLLHHVPQWVGSKGWPTFPVALEMTCLIASSVICHRSATYLSRNIVSEFYDFLQLLCTLPVDNACERFASWPWPHFRVQTHDASRDHHQYEQCAFQRRLDVSRHLCSGHGSPSVHHKMNVLCVQGEVSPFLPRLWQGQLAAQCQCATRESRYGASALRVWEILTVTSCANSTLGTRIMRTSRPAILWSFARLDLLPIRLSSCEIVTVHACLRSWVPESKHVRAPSEKPFTWHVCTTRCTQFHCCWFQPLLIHIQLNLSITCTSAGVSTSLSCMTKYRPVSWHSWPKRWNQNCANCHLIRITDENVLIVLLTCRVQQFCLHGCWQCDLWKCVIVFVKPFMDVDDDSYCDSIFTEAPRTCHNWTLNGIVWTLVRRIVHSTCPPVATNMSSRTVSDSGTSASGHHQISSTSASSCVNSSLIITTLNLLSFSSMFSPSHSTQVSTPTTNRTVAVLDPCTLAFRDRSRHSRHTDHSGSLGQMIALQFVHVVLVPHTIVVVPFLCGSVDSGQRARPTVRDQVIHKLSLTSVREKGDQEVSGARMWKTKMWMARFLIKFFTWRSFL